VFLDRLTKAPPPLDPLTLKPKTAEPSSTSSQPALPKPHPLSLQPAPSSTAATTPQPASTSPGSADDAIPSHHDASSPEEIEHSAIKTGPDEAAEGKTADDQRYVVDHIKAYKDSDKKYLVHWYGFNDSADDTWEPAEHIPANLRTRFHKSQEAKAARRQLSRRGRRRLRRGGK